MCFFEQCIIVQSPQGYWHILTLSMSEVFSLKGLLNNACYGQPLLTALSNDQASKGLVSRGNLFQAKVTKDFRTFNTGRKRLDV